MLSKHAQHRNQQRCLPPIVNDWLDKFGEERYDGHGGIKIFFSKRSQRQMEQYLGRHFIRDNKKYLSVYRVESSKDGTIITCGWKFTNFRKN